jgi:hypothetical protein
MRLRLESRHFTGDRTSEARTATGATVMMTPELDEDYCWAYRVKLSDTQAVLGFPKFGTIGIGFAREDVDWNTNLPYKADAEHILSHIIKNKGGDGTEPHPDDAISNDDVLQAIRMIQVAARLDRKDPPADGTVPHPGDDA